MTKGAHPLRPPLLFSLSGLGIVCLSVLFTPTYPPRDDFSPDNLILFFSALPLLNALYDFASVGLTRHWLRKGLGGNMVWNGTRDAVAGLAIFIALGCTAIAFIHFVRPQDGVPLIDLPTLFDDLARNPGDYWWLFFMLFSTLLPTMTHAGIALFSAFTLAGPRLRAWLARLFRMGGRGDTHPDWIARTVLSALIAASVWLPVFVVVEGPALFPGLVDALTGVFRSFAEAIGALPPGVQI